MPLSTFLDLYFNSQLIGKSVTYNTKFINFVKFYKKINDIPCDIYAYKGLNYYDRNIKKKLNHYFLATPFTTVPNPININSTADFYNSIRFLHGFSVTHNEDIYFNSFEGDKHKMANLKYKLINFFNNNNQQRINSTPTTFYFDLNKFSFFADIDNNPEIQTHNFLFNDYMEKNLLNTDNFYTANLENFSKYNNLFIKHIGECNTIPINYFNINLKILIHVTETKITIIQHPVFNLIFDELVKNNNFVFNAHFAKIN